jgi:hypothetical protein
MKTIQIFLASSAELKSDRDELRIFLSVENDRLKDRGIYLQLVQWEYFFDAISDTRMQDEYNKVLKQCDIALNLFYTKAGKYTQEEFSTALKRFKETHRPYIFTYFKKAPTKKLETSLIEFEKYLSGLGHFPSHYTTIDDLKVQLKRQLEKIVDDIEPQIVEEREEIKELIKSHVKADIADSKNVVKGSTITAGGNVNIGDTNITESTASKRLRIFLYAFVPLLAIGLALLYIKNKDLNTPVNLTVMVRDATPNPNIPMDKSTVTLIYGDKTEVQTIDKEANFKGIPANFKNKDISLKVESQGFLTVEKTVQLSSEAIAIPMNRDNSLATLSGNVTDGDGNPIADAEIRVQDITVKSDASGAYKMIIPFEKQRPSQRIKVFKKGYKIWDFESNVIPNESVNIVLNK